MNDETAKKSGKEETTRPKMSVTSVAIICLSSLLAVVAFCLTLVYLNTPKRYAQEDMRNTLDTQAVDSEEDEAVQKVAEGMFQMSMNTIWDFPSGDKPSSQAYVANVKNNTKPFILEVSIDETDELVYTSPIIPVGTDLESLVLDTPLEKGDYPASCKYILLNEDGSENSTFIVAVTISVAN